MKMYSVLKAILPSVVLLCIISLLYLIPINTELQPSAISPELPFNCELDGWYGQKTQAGKEERQVLSADTKFSKGVYRRCSLSSETLPALSDGSDSSPEVYTYGPQVSVSIVYSGLDMNGSIHRPERCLPSQGHQQLEYSEAHVKLGANRTVTLSKLQSLTVDKNRTGGVLHHIHYYVFVGHSRVTHSHVYRSLYDIWNRVVYGRVQSWAYLQIGSHWGGGTGITEQEADEAVLELMGRLLERQIDWSAIKD